MSELGIRDPAGPRRRRARPDHRRAGRPDLPDDVVRVPRHRARGGALRARGARQHLHADHEPDPGRVRGAHDRARGWRRRARGGERAGRADDRAAEPRRERRAHRVDARRSTAAPTTSCTTRSRSSASRSASSTTPTTSTRGRRRSARTPRRSTARASATRRATSSTSRASPTVAHDNGIPLVIDNTLASPYLLPAAASTAPTSSCTRRRSSSAVTARRSAGSSSTAASSTTSASGRFPGFTEPDPSYHGLVFSQLPEPLRPAQYILKARLQYQRDIGAGDRRRSTRSCSSRASRR